MKSRIDFRGLIGLGEAALAARLGPAVSRRNVGGDVWAVFEGPGLTVRARLEATVRGAEPRIASWTAGFVDGFATLAEAAAALGLWPDAGPDVVADELDAPLIRRALPAAGGGATHSLTATARGGRFIQVSVFDERPDWL